MWPRSDLRKQRIREAFQYRKRYEVTCDSLASTGGEIVSMFQYRKRYEVTYDFTISTFIDKDTLVSIPQAVWGHMWLASTNSYIYVSCPVSIPQAVWGHMWLWAERGSNSGWSSFNTASGMRSHVTSTAEDRSKWIFMFQYRKRYEVTCDLSSSTKLSWSIASMGFQYRKRYEVTCDLTLYTKHGMDLILVSIPQAVWGHMWHGRLLPPCWKGPGVSIPQAVWGHMWLMTGVLLLLAADAAWVFQYRKRYEVTCDKARYLPKDANV